MTSLIVHTTAQLEDLAEPFFDDDEDVAFCPICDGEGVLLGTLGHLQHFRCRCCGAGFSFDLRSVS